MGYRSIAVHISRSDRAQERIQLAATIAKKFDSHLIGVAATGLATLGGQWSGAESGFYYADIQRRQREHCVEAARIFEEMVRRSGVERYEHRIADDEDSNAMALTARYADLVVIGQDNAADPTIGTRPNFSEEVIVHAGRPVLLVPYAGHFDSVGSDVLVAWDASREAARALTDALPLLKDAQLVRVVIVGGHPSLDGHGDEPGADVALFLARHGVTVEVVRAAASTDIAGVLLTRAADFGSDLIVMGGYGHSRFREMLLGGVTRAMLEAMTVPVLMSH